MELLIFDSRNRNFVLHEVNVEQIFHRLKKYERKQLQENKTNNTATATAVNADEIIDNLDDF